MNTKLIKKHFKNQTLFYIKQSIANFFQKTVIFNTKISKIQKCRLLLKKCLENRIEKMLIHSKYIKKRN